MRWFMILLMAMAVNAATPAHADVLVSFWSHDQDRNYPHAFLRMVGRIESTRRAVDTNVGFTARSISPAVFVGSVSGTLEHLSRGYLARPTNHAHFALRLNDAQYAALEAFMVRWRSMPQPSYNLLSRNCVHFIMEAAAVLGLRVNRQSSHFREPGLFLDEVVALNPSLQRGGH